MDGSRSVLAVKGLLRRFAPWTAAGRSEEDVCVYEGKGGPGRVDGPEGNPFGHTSTLSRSEAKEAQQRLDLSLRTGEIA